MSTSERTRVRLRETPREVRDALALSELIDRTGASTELRAFDEVYTTFAVAVLSELAKRREETAGAELRSPTA